MIQTFEARGGGSVAIVITKREVEYPSYRIEETSNRWELLYPLGIVSKSEHPRKKSYPWGHTGNVDLHFRTRTEAIDSLLRIRKVIP
jgi:hypothetical protein